MYSARVSTGKGSSRSGMLLLLVNLAQRRTARNAARLLIGNDQKMLNALLSQESVATWNRILDRKPICDFLAAYMVDRLNPKWPICHRRKLKSNHIEIKSQFFLSVPNTFLQLSRRSTALPIAFGT